MTTPGFDSDEAWRQIYANLEAQYADTDDDKAESKVTPPPELLAVETYQTVIVVDSTGGAVLAPFPGGAKTILNLLKQHGWKPFKGTASRGAAMHGGHGTFLGFKDFYMLRAQKPHGSGFKYVAAMWVDSKFEYAYACLVEPGKDAYPQRVNSDRLKAMIKA